MDTNACIYEINRADQIVYCNDFWDDFALQNGSPEMVSSRVRSRFLWDHIDGIETVELYRQIVKRARQGHVVRFGFRCDSATIRRDMRMTVEGRPNELVRFTSEILEESGPFLGLYNEPAITDPSAVSYCCWCNRMRSPEGKWTEIENAVDRFRIFERPSTLSVARGICEPCTERVCTAIQ